MAKIILFYNSHKVLCGGCLYSLYVDAVVVLAQYVLSLSVWRGSLLICVEAVLYQ